MHQVERYWLFAAFCFAVGLVLLRLIVRERVTLQNSLGFLAFLLVFTIMALTPDRTLCLARQMGFTLASNFLFAVGIGSLAILHVATLITLSRLELRSVALTQEVAMVREKLDRELRPAESRGPRDST